jgi:glycosyltransferase involved in cell wall biosynthesis
VICSLAFSEVMSNGSESSNGGWLFPIGVIIPTYNRADVLLLCLEHLEAQSWKNFEVIIVDDGSTDDTERQVQNYTMRTPLALRYLRQSNSGPARARNQAIALLQSPVCLMIGDDILASPSLVQIHLALHEERPEPRVTGLGYTRWSEKGQTVTSFMRWLDRDGQQFAYRELMNGVAPSWKHFYTSNLSLKTEHLLAHQFHEGFRKAAMEDIELGYRMAQQNELEIVFLREAIADHLHPTTVQQACRRMIGVGAAGYLFEQLWPQSMPKKPNTIKLFLRAILTDEHRVLPLLRETAALVTRGFCPNPLLLFVLQLHFKFGYQNEKALNERRATTISLR